MKSYESPLKRKLVDFSHRCAAEGWCPGTLGNISALDPKSGSIFIKRSGSDLSRLSLREVLELDPNGKVLQGIGNPSIETGLHLSIYNVRKEVGAVFHVHPPFATAYAVAESKIPMVTEAARIVLADVPLLFNAPPGSLELAKIVENGFKDANVKAALLSKHGVVAVGKTIEESYHTTALVEDTAKIAFLSSIIKNNEK